MHLPLALPAPISENLSALMDPGLLFGEFAGLGFTAFRLEEFFNQMFVVLGLRDSGLGFVFRTSKLSI